MNFSLIDSDLSYMHSCLAKQLGKIENTSVFITGANGFFGIWLIESILYMNEKDSLSVNVYALTRSKESFYKNFPHLQEFSNLCIVEGSILDYTDDFLQLDYIIHAANLPYDNLPCWAERHMDYAVNGTKKIMFTAKKYAVQSVLFTSSGAVYNNFHTQSTEHYAESDFVTQAEFNQVYSMGKIVSEQILKSLCESEKIPVTIARCFAFAGAHLPLENFAFGNFIKNALLREDIVIKGDGESIRSYLYGADLVVYLLTLLVNTKDYQVYNVGSSQGISIKSLAKKIGHIYSLNVDILGKADTGNAPQAYVPNMEKLYHDFNFAQPLDLEHCIENMYVWNEDKCDAKS